MAGARGRVSGRLIFAFDCPRPELYVRISDNAVGRVVMDAIATLLLDDRYATRFRGTWVASAFSCSLSARTNSVMSRAH